MRFFETLKKHAVLIIGTIIVILFVIGYPAISRRAGMFFERGYIEKYIFYAGFYDNEPGGVWIDGNASIVMFENKEARHFTMMGLYAEHMPPNKITVTINNNESKTVEMIPGKKFTIELTFANTLEYIDIGIKTEKTFIPKDEGWSDDIRVLGAYITAWALDDFYVFIDSEPYVITGNAKHKLIIKDFPGFYDDNWIGGEVYIVYYSQTAKLLQITGLYPEIMPSINSFTVTINNKESSTIDLVPGDDIDMELDFDSATELIIVKLKTDKVVIPFEEGWSTDSRELGVIIYSFSFSDGV